MENSEPFEIPNRGKNDKNLRSESLLQPHYPIPKIFLVVNLLNLRSECLVSYDPHFPGNDGTKEPRKAKKSGEKTKRKDQEKRPRETIIKWIG